VTVDKVIAVLRQNTAYAQNAIEKLAAIIDPTHTCQGAIRDAIMTAKEAIPPETKRKMGILTDQYLDH
jgi:hypothetical protein